MKVLLDHNIPVQIATLVENHEIVSARDMLWDLLGNGDLLRAAEQTGFHVMVTGDKSIYYQQNNQLRKIALVVLSTNDWAAIVQNGPLIEAAIERSVIGSFELVQIPKERKPSQR